MSDEKPGFAELFEKEEAVAPLRVQIGDRVEGTVAHVGADGVFVDLGGATQAFFPRASLLDVHGAMKVAEGETLAGFVTKITEDGGIELGTRLERGFSRDQAAAAMEQQMPVEGKVVGVNRGGAKVDLGGLSAFCPKGQIDKRFVEDLSVFLQQTLTFHVVELKEGGDVVVSRRSILEAEAASARATALERIRPGERLHGKIASVRDFGAFVDLGGVDGLIATRELSYDRRRPDQVVSVGDSVEVMVLDVEERDGKLRISLSLKATGADPWESVDRVAPTGTVVQGVVRRLMDFGAFVELSPGIEGLLHVSELGAGARHPSSYLSVGDPLLVVVHSVDTERKRISLAPAPKGTVAGAAVKGDAVRAGDVVTGTVAAVERYGVFLQLEGLTGKRGRGLIPERELDVAEGTDLRKTFPVGKEMKAKVLETDRLKLSVKALKEDEDRKVFEDYKKEQGGAGMGTFADLLKGKLKG